MKVLVVEEEKRIAVKLEKALKNIDYSIRITATTPAIFSSANWLQQCGVPDIVLMRKDIARNQQLTQIEPSTVNAIVMVRDEEQLFTFHAFRITHLEHLLPPAFFEKMESSDVMLVMPATATVQHVQPVTTSPASYRNRFLVRQGQKFASIEIQAIAYFFSEGRFIFFKTYDNQKYLVEYTLEELDTMLNPGDFFRVNRSHVIAFKSVEQIHPYFGNRLKLFLNPATEKDIIVSREKVNDFKEWLGE
ncbi:MAG: LytTR family transcriptional regulator DNA-binding domain-containing protein [Chitinophagaceae bacterium]